MGLKKWYESLRVFSGAEEYVMSNVTPWTGMSKVGIVLLIEKWVES